LGFLVLESGGASQIVAAYDRIAPFHWLWQRSIKYFIKQKTTAKYVGTKVVWAKGARIYISAWEKATGISASKALSYSSPFCGNTGNSRREG